MLRKKIIKEQAVKSTNDTVSILKKNKPLEDRIEQSDSSNNNIVKNTITTQTKMSANQDIGKWLIDKITSERSIKNLQDNLLVPIANVEKDSKADEWLNMLIKSYFTKEDVGILASNIRKIENEKQEIFDTIEKLNKNNEILQKTLNEAQENVEKEKNRSFKLQKKIDQMMHMKDFIEYNFENVEGSEKIKQLLLEATKSDSEHLEDFIIPFAINSQNIIMVKKYMKNNEDSDLNMFMDEIKILLKSISGKYIPQRKELLEELAKTISRNFEELEFISPEEYTYVEPKLHNIPTGGGQKVIEGKSFAVIKAETKQTIIYADIEAQ